MMSAHGLAGLEGGFERVESLDRAGRRGKDKKRRYEIDET